MIEKFPNFTPFSLSQKEKVYDYLKNFAPYGDFSLTNLVIWLNLEDDLEISDLDNNLILRFTNVFANPKKRTYCFIGLVNVDDALTELSEYLKDHGEDLTLYSVPEETITLINKYAYYEDRDSFDYVLNTEEQVKLLGTRFGKYRRKVNSFINTNIDSIVIKEIDLNIPEQFHQLVNSLHTWKRTYELGGNDNEGLEAHALTRSFKYHEVLRLKSVAITINNKIESFTLFSIDEVNSIADIHHTKCSYEQRNVFDFTLYATASKLRSEGIKYMNLEQDLGIEGLREHKLGLRPSHYLRKYTVDLSTTIQ